MYRFFRTPPAGAADRAELLASPQPGRSRNAERIAFERAARTTLVMVSLVGIGVALAAILPAAIRFPALLAALLAWIVALANSSARGLVAAFRLPTSPVGFTCTIIALLGTGIVVLSTLQLELIRTFQGRPDLLWNIDWRYALGHAQGIARYGSLDHALDYAGASVEYHVGPAWLAAAVQRIFGFGLTDTLLGVVPALGVVSAVTALIHLLARAGLSYRVAAAAASVAACMPLGFQRFFLNGLREGPGEIFINSDSWVFAAGLMPNAGLGIAVGLAAMTLVLDRSARTAEVLIGGLGLASLVQIKPEFFISLGAIAGIVAVCRALPLPTSRPRSLAAGLGCTAALAASVVSIRVLPRYPTVFAPPKFGLAFEAYSIEIAGIELVLVPLLSAILVVMYARRAIGKHRSAPGGLVELTLGLVVATTALAIALSVLRLEVRPDIFANAASVGWSDAMADAPLALVSMMFPVRLLLSAVLLGALVYLATKFSRPALALLLLIFCVIVFSPTLYILNGFREPLERNEAIEETALRQVVQSIPVGSELLISNDIADPANDYRRMLRGFALTAYSPHAFLVSNIGYLNYMHPDAGDRLLQLRAFFNAPWSPWHDAWLHSTGITHVLVHDRCPPAWWADRDVLLSPVASVDGWSAFAVRAPEHSSTSDVPAFVLSLPRYGAAACLG